MTPNQINTGAVPGVCDQTSGQAWQCAARRQALPEPADCNWPDCGCDPHATKVIEALLEQGWFPTARPADAAVAWWRWRFKTQGHWSKWIALDTDGVDAFRELQGHHLESGHCELQPLYAQCMTNIELIKIVADLEARLALRDAAIQRAIDEASER